MKCGSASPSRYLSIKNLEQDRLSVQCSCFSEAGTRQGKERFREGLQVICIRMSPRREDQSDSDFTRFITLKGMGKTLTRQAAVVDEGPEVVKPRDKA